MQWNRRDVLSLGLLGAALPALDREAAPSPSLCGLVIHSFAVRTAADRSLPVADRFAEPHRFLAHARMLGAKGVQVGLGVLDAPQANALRRHADEAGMYLEGIVSLPGSEADLDRSPARCA